MRTIILGSSAAVLLSGCAIHPVPEDVTGLNTAQIVRKIRCEARQAYVDMTLSGLEHIMARHEKQGMPDLVRKDRALIEAIANNHRHVLKLDPKKASPAAAQFVERFNGTQMAFDFTLNMSITNDTTSKFGFTDAIYRGTFAPGVSADLKRSRTNERGFRILDTPGSLLNALTTADCEKVGTGTENHLYPIAGDIGLREVFGTFMELAQHWSLGVAGKSFDTPYLVDTLTFSTTVSGSLTPKVTLSPAGKGFALASAEGTLTAGRTDIHKVVVSLAEEKPAPAASTGGGRTSKRVSSSENMAVRAINERNDQKLGESLRVLRDRLPLQ